MSPRTSRALATLALLLGATPLASAETLVVPSDAFPTIQSAIIAAEVGDVVKVKKGVYRENVTIFQNDFTLQGKKAVIDGGLEGPCLRIGAQDVSVSGFTLVNGTWGIVDDATFLDDEGGSPPDRLSVSKCEVRSCLVGIELIADEVVIEKSVVRDCGEDGIVLTATGSLQPVIVSRNTIANTGGRGIDIEAFSVFVDRNDVSRCAFDGIRLELVLPVEGTGTSNTVVSRNTVEDCLGVGLRIDAPFLGARVLRNECVRNGRGMSLEGESFLVGDNECSGNTESGMRLGGAVRHFAQSEVEGNEVRNNGVYGIEVTAPPVCRIDPTVPNVFRDNEVRGNGRDGLNIDHAHRDEFHDNLFAQNGGDGLDVDAGLFDLVFDGNRFLKNEHEGLDNSGFDTVMRGNRLKGNARGEGPDLAGTGDDGTGNVIDEGKNVFDTGDFDVPSRLDLEPED